MAYSTSSQVAVYTALICTSRSLPTVSVPLIIASYWSTKAMPSMGLLEMHVLNMKYSEHSTFAIVDFRYLHTKVTISWTLGKLEPSNFKKRS